MKPGERIAIIKRIATRLGAEEDWADIDLVLEQFGFATEWRWEGNAKSYVLHCIKNDTDAKLAALDQYLMGHSRPDDEPWEDAGFRLFVTHLAKHKSTAHSLKSHLRFYGVDAFVAHDDIRPGKEWQLVIESALHSCDALVGLLHAGFRESDWCDQEVGFALGRGVPVVPIHFDLYPYGFFGSVQAIINAGTQEIKALARRLTLILLHDKRTADRLTEAIVEQLVNAGSFDQANRLSALLATEAPLLSQEQAHRLREAEKENGQLQGAFDFGRNVSAVEAKILAVRPPATTDDFAEEPF
ncbi:MAG: toll/interleukin-1 receptor domain-containing protein [Pseudomonadota bacterium]|nr:toll/interleukin-1 receptor domain-containing protein [Pseudomonadota bacterium]